MAQIPENVLGPITIESLAHGGEGVGRFDGKTMFISGALPGDVVYATIHKSKKRFAKGLVQRIAESSPKRVEAQCPHVDVCGGCPWQNYDYAAQLEAKQDILVQQLIRLGGLSSEDVPDVEVIHGNPYEYRRTLRLMIRDGAVGYRQQKSHKLAAVKQCPIVQPKLWQSVAGLVRSLSKIRDGELQATLGDDGKAVAVSVDVKDNGCYAAALADRLMNAPGVVSVKIRAAGRVANRGERLLHLEKDLWISPGGFVQGNREVNRSMVRVVADWSAQVKPTRCLELYVGSGNFTRILAAELARQDGELVAVESVASAVQAARHGSSHWEGGSNIRWITKEVGPGILDAGQKIAAADLIVLDPPRTGAAEAIPLVKTLCPRAVISVSCDPATHARDIKSMRDLGYRIEKLVMADQFPHTYHSESLALLQRVKD